MEEVSDIIKKKFPKGSYLKTSFMFQNGDKYKEGRCLIKVDHYGEPTDMEKELGIVDEGVYGEYGIDAQNEFVFGSVRTFGILSVECSVPTQEEIDYLEKCKEEYLSNNK